MLLWCLGWNLRTATNSLNLKAPEIIIQTKSEKTNQLDHDGIIPASESLAYVLQGKNLALKKIHCVHEKHNDSLDNNNLSQVKKFIEESLSIYRATWLLGKHSPHKSIVVIPILILIFGTIYSVIQSLLPALEKPK